MSFIALVVAAEEHVDQTHSWILPEGYEIWFGGIASVIVFGLLFWKVGPVARKAMAARTQRVQDDLDASKRDEEEAVAEAARIRQAKGDIESERARLLAEADERAAALLSDGRSRLEDEVADLDAKATADIESASGRSADELRGEIAGFAAATAERVVQSSLDGETQQRLIEDFIANVGRTGTAAGATS
jgi:F-type H+-transporting ATPase subunit b